MGQELTKSDVEKIQAEIDHRKLVLRPQITKEIAEAAAQGDRSENFEYYAAKKANRENNGRINYLERVLRFARIIDDSSKDDEVGLNNTVTLYFEEDDEEETYRIVTPIGKPLVLGFLVGLILGDPVQGTIAGATIQLIYLGVMSTGGSYPADAGLAGIIGTASVILGGLSTSEAVAVAVPIGLAGTVLFQLRMLSAVPFTHLADKAAEEGNSKKLFFANMFCN